MIPKTLAHLLKGTGCGDYADIPNICKRTEADAAFMWLSVVFVGGLDRIDVHGKAKVWIREYCRCHLERMLGSCCFC